MHPRYEESTNHLIIEWYETKKSRDGRSSSPVHHYYSGIPKTIQLHPKDPTKIVRATFMGDKYGKMPGWMEKYAREHHFECKQVTHNGEMGWWIANWVFYSDGNKPFSSPYIEGALKQFSQNIPDVFDNLKETLLSNCHIVKSNLRHYPTVYNSLGLYYRSEEMEGESGSLLIDYEIIPKREGDESDDDYRLRISMDGRLERLIHELVAPLPEPEGTGTLDDIEEEILEEEWTLDEHDFEIEDQGVEETELEIEFGEEALFLEEVEILDDSIIEDEVLDSVEVEFIEEEELVDDQFITDEPNNLSPSEEGLEDQTDLITSDETSLKVVEDRDKKGGVVEGQFSLF